MSFSDNVFDTHIYQGRYVTFRSFTSVTACHYQLLQIQLSPDLSSSSYSTSSFIALPDTQNTTNREAGKGFIGHPKNLYNDLIVSSLGPPDKKMYYEYIMTEK
jgi:hypothetical protein